LKRPKMVERGGEKKEEKKEVENLPYTRRGPRKGEKKIVEG